MTTIERWTIWPRPIFKEPALAFPGHGLEIPYVREEELIEVVPASQLARTAGNNEALRAAIATTLLRLEALPVSPRLLIAIGGLEAALDIA